MELVLSCITSYLCNPQITVKLDLRNNNLQELPRGAFTHTPYLTHLNLQRCNINKVKEGAFRALGRVVSLNLAYNKIDILYQVNTYSQNSKDGGDNLPISKTLFRPIQFHSSLFLLTSALHVAGVL